MKLTEKKARGARRRDTRAFIEARAGFTLVELMTVIAIIGMLSAVSITTVRAAIQSARDTQTRTTIAKIDSVLTESYEKYQYRRVDLSDIPNANAITRATVRVNRMRDLLRRDFPCTALELDTRIPNADTKEWVPFNASHSRFVTPLQVAYSEETTRVDEEGNYYNTLGRRDINSSLDPIFENAELLYLVVMNVDPEARAGFAEREIADLNGNGLSEFIDGWGRPICWMRWAPGLERSDRQPLASDVLTNTDDSFSAPEDVADPDASSVQTNPTMRRVLDPADVDPFDPLSVRNGWFLVPYVYSAGPDGEYGLFSARDSELTENRFFWMDDPFRVIIGGNASEAIGSPKDKTYKDNIDNHTLVR